MGLGFVILVVGDCGGCWLFFFFFWWWLAVAVAVVVVCLD